MFSPPPILPGDWRPIDASAKRRRRVLVREGDNYATAYWTGGAGGSWKFCRTTNHLHFEPTEYHP